MSSPDSSPLVLDEDARTKLTQRTDAVLQDWPLAVRQLARNRLAAAVSQIIGIDLTDLLLEAWSRWDELLEAADKSTNDPDVETLVSLGSRPFGTGREYELEIVIDGKRLDTVQLAFRVWLEFRELAAAVANGCITRVESGSCHLEATLTADDVVLTKWPRDIDLTTALIVDPPLRIRRPATPAPRDRRIDLADGGQITRQRVEP